MHLRRSVPPGGAKGAFEARGIPGFEPSDRLIRVNEIPFDEVGPYSCGEVLQREQASEVLVLRRHAGSFRGVRVSTTIAEAGGAASLAGGGLG